MFNPELEEIRRRYNILREQYQKLQGSMMVLQATVEEQNTNIEKMGKERDKYKKAFEEIFINNIGNAWEKYPDEEKAKLTVEKKISFFNNEVNMSKLYIRKRMEDRMAETIEENHRLKTELVKVKAQLEQKEEELKNSRTLGFGGRNLPKGALVNEDDLEVRQTEPATDSLNADEKVKKEEDSLRSKLFGLFGKKPRGVGASSADSPSGSSKEQAGKPAPENKPHKEEKMPSMEAAVSSKPKAEEKMTTNPEQAAAKGQNEDKKQTTNFWKNFRKAPENVQREFKTRFPMLDAALEQMTLGKELVMVIGSSGLYLFDDIYKKGVELGYWENADTDLNRVRRAIDKMSSSKDGSATFLTNGSEIKSIGKGRPKKTYLLSKVGEAWYALSTLQDPLRSLLIVRAKEQKSVEHAELIQRMVSVLKSADFETYQEVPLATSTVGETSIADISANKGSDINIRIECEMGNYDTPSYVFKFAKALEVSDRLLVGVPTNDVKDKIKVAIQELIREHYKGIDNFRKQGKDYLVFTLKELTDNPNLILPKKEKRW